MLKQQFIFEKNNLPKTRLIIEPPTLVAADDPTVALPPLLWRVYILDLLLFYFTDIPNKGADQNKRVRGKYSFIYNISMVEIFLINDCSEKKNTKRLRLVFFFLERTLLTWKIESMVESFYKKAKHEFLSIMEFRVFTNLPIKLLAKIQ